MALHYCSLHNLRENNIYRSTHTHEPACTARKKNARAPPVGLYKDFIIFGRD